MEKRKQYLQIFANFLLLGVIVFACVKMVPFLVKLFLPFIVAYIIYLIADPIVNFFENKIKLKRKFTAPLIIVFILILFFFLIYFLVKNVYSFITNIIDNWDSIYESINEFVLRVDQLLSKFNIDIQGTNLSGNISKYIGNFSEKVIEYSSSFVLNVPMLIFTIVITLMAAFYLIQDNGKTVNKFYKKHESIQKIKTQVIDQSIKYIKAQFKIMLIIFLILAFFLGMLGIKYFIPLAFLIAFVDLLPILGTGTIMIPWSIIEFILGDYAKGIILFFIYLIAMVARQFLQPKIIGQSMEFPSFLTLIVMYIGYKLYSFTGLLLSVPVGVFVLRLYQVGIFDVYINSIKFITNDIKNFLKIKF